MRPTDFKSKNAINAIVLKQRRYWSRHVLRHFSLFLFNHWQLMATTVNIICWQNCWQAHYIAYHNKKAASVSRSGQIIRKRLQNITIAAKQASYFMKRVLQIVRKLVKAQIKSPLPDRSDKGPTYGAIQNFV